MEENAISKRDPHQATRRVKPGFPLVHRRLVQDATTHLPKQLLIPHARQPRVWPGKKQILVPCGNLANLQATAKRAMPEVGCDFLAADPLVDIMQVGGGRYSLRGVAWSCPLLQPSELFTWPRAGAKRSAGSNETSCRPKSHKVRAERSFLGFPSATSLGSPICSDKATYPATV